MSVVKVLLLYWESGIVAGAMLLHSITGKRSVFVRLKKVSFISLPPCLSFRTSPPSRRQIISHSPALTRLINLGWNLEIQ